MFRTRELYTHALRVVKNITGLTGFLGKSRGELLLSSFKRFSGFISQNLRQFNVFYVVISFVMFIFI